MDWNILLGGIVILLSILYSIQNYRDYKKGELDGIFIIKGFGAGFFGFLLGLFMLLGKVTFF